MSGPDVVTLGEPLGALVALEPGPLRFGSGLELQVAGAELNLAVGLARLGHQTAFIGCVGHDRLGRLALRELRAEGVRAVVRTVGDAPTGLLMRDLSANQPAEVDYLRAGSAGARLGPGDVTGAAGLFGGARFLHLTGITPALSDTCMTAWEAAHRVARQHQVRVSLDVNYRARLWTRERAAAVLWPLASTADLVFGSADELVLLTGSPDPRSAARVLLEAGAATVVLKEDGRGATAIARDGETHQPAEPVGVSLDPVGAGDAFAAGVLSGLLDDLTLDRALRRGHRCAVRVIGTRGDLPGLPHRDELEQAGEISR